MLTTFRDLFRYNIEFRIGIVLVAIVTVFAGLSWFSPYPPEMIYVVVPDQPPSAEYWFGTNSRGQDLFWNLMERMAPDYGVEDDVSATLFEFNGR